MPNKKFKSQIEFTVWENDLPYTVQLEPYAFQFVTKTNSSLVFVPINPKPNFTWVIRYEEKNGIQLFPDGEYESVEVYRDNELIGNEFIGEF
jgi:Leu/Phe-tRNA-protein transferase